MPAVTSTLQSNAQSGFVKSVYSFKTDQIKVPDDFEIELSQRPASNKSDARTRTHSEGPAACRTE
jgi:hypothetical protein